MYERRLQRLVRIMACLHAGVGLTTRDLANRLGVCKRTVYRDLRLLRDAGVPTYHDEEVGHVIEPGFRWDAGLLSDVQFATLLLAASTSSLNRSPFLATIIDEAIEKMLSRAPIRIREAGGRVLRSCRREFPAASPEEPYDSDALVEIIEAIRLGQSIRIRVACAGARGPEIETKLSSFTLVLAPTGFYVVGRSSLHGAVRRFTVGDISAVARLDERPARRVRRG